MNFWKYHVENLGATTHLWARNDGRDAVHVLEAKAGLVRKRKERSVVAHLGRQRVVKILRYCGDYASHLLFWMWSEAGHLLPVPAPRHADDFAFLLPHLHHGCPGIFVPVRHLNIATELDTLGAWSPRARGRREAAREVPLEVPLWADLR